MKKLWAVAKKLWSVTKKLWRPLLLIVPLLIGLIGLLWEGEPFLQALFYSVCMYTLNFQEVPANICVELGRWLAPLATASSVVLVVSALRRYLLAFFARCTGESVAVFGPEEEKAPLLKELGVHGIDMGDKPVKAHSYILLGTEAENLELYQKYKELLHARDVYLKCSSLPSQASTHAKLHLFCPEESAARLFWKAHRPIALAAQNHYQLKIAIIGFEKMGKELLLQALKNNIFDPKQRIEYHIFGSEKGFSNIYRQLSEISDPVIFHKAPWHQSVTQLEEADMIVVARQNRQLELLQALTLALPGKAMHVLTADEQGTALLCAAPNLCFFDWKEKTRGLENILDTRLYTYAKRINLRYANLYGGVEETDENREAQWAKLDTFTRYSNISAADYHDVQITLRAQQPEKDLSQQLEKLSELEHIRWCRYHYLNNWHYGNIKDAAQRIHTCLIPYEQLSEAEKQKDRDNVLLLFRLDEE